MITMFTWVPWFFVALEHRVRRVSRGGSTVLVTEASTTVNG